MELKVLWITRVTPSQITLNSMPFYQVTVQTGGEIFSLYHQFDYHPDTFDESDLDSWNSTTKAIESLIKVGKLKESNTIGIGTKTETYNFD